jgi:hypothetical protein
VGVRRNAAPGGRIRDVGADLVNGETGTRRECADEFSGAACVAAHGLVDIVGDELVAATDSPEILRLRLDGTTLARLNTKLRDNHLMEFVVDESRAELAAAGPCFYAGGLSIVSLITGSARLLATPGSARARSVCGGRVAFVGASIVIARTQRAAAIPAGGATVAIVDSRSGRVRRTIRTTGEAVDVVAIP